MHVEINAMGIVFLMSDWKNKHWYFGSVQSPFWTKVSKRLSIVLGDLYPHLGFSYRKCLCFLDCTDCVVTLTGHTNSAPSNRVTAGNSGKN